MTKKYKLEILVSKNGQYYWHIKAKNGQLIATSGETFTTKSNCRESVLKVIDAFNDSIVDISVVK
jgi:uncharacterized protein YegP (UPF0339 family)